MTHRISTVVTLRVVDCDDPQVPSMQMLCDVCHEKVWLARSSPRGCQVVCLQCAPLVVRGQSTGMMTDAQRASLHAAGLSDDDIERVIQQATEWIDRHR